MNHVRNHLVLWFLWFLICMGLGYPTLNRYGPGDVPGLYDAKAYHAMVLDQPLDPGQTDLGHRILVPYLARPIYRVAAGHLHTWNPGYFALLVVNAFFTATTALLLYLSALRIFHGISPALIAAFLFLLNFAVANLNLSAYVDSAVNCLLMAIVWSMLSQRWVLLPLWGVLGASAKETFVPMCVCLALAWWFSSGAHGRKKIPSLLWIAGLILSSAVTLALVMKSVNPAVTPLSFAASRSGGPQAGFLFLGGLVRCLTAREFLFTFGWLLPLGSIRLSRLPRPWVIGSICAGLAALLMGAYDDALGNAARAIFSALGPLFSLSAALLLLEFHTPDRQDSTTLPQS